MFRKSAFHFSGLVQRSDSEIFPSHIVRPRCEVAIVPISSLFWSTAHVLQYLLMALKTNTSHTTNSSPRGFPDVELAEHPIPQDTVQSTPDIDVQQFTDHQSRALPHSRLMVVFPVLALAQFTAYLDQTSISTAVPAIGDALGLGASLPWVATAYLLATTAVQLANGRLSDIFGRKRLLITSLVVLAVGNLVAGFATSPGMLFAFRAVSGLGGGAMSVRLDVFVELEN